jgi:hypothetical protein
MQLVVSISRRIEELRLKDPVYNLSSSISRLESGFFKCISWLNRFFFIGDDRDFQKRGSQGQYNGTKPPTLPLNSSSLFSVFSFIVRGSTD